jgi:hypothetical protein
MTLYIAVSKDLVPALTNQAERPPHVLLHLFQAREQIMTIILRVGAVVGLISFLFVVLAVGCRPTPVLQANP